MVTLNEVVAYLDSHLEVARFSDYCPNGLQIEGRGEIRRIVSGVTACYALLERARELKADAILVHHGYFWRGASPCLTGLHRQRVATLLAADISLLAYHLPLDAHPLLGNNAQLAAHLGLTTTGRFEQGSLAGIACHGTLDTPLDVTAFADRIAANLGRVPLHIAGGPATISRVGWCSGAAQEGIETAAALGLDAYVSGEISEPTVHLAREAGIHYFAAGHHATERYGVQALGEHLAERYELEHISVDIDNPV